MFLPAFAVLAFATITVSPGDGCPTAAAVKAELARLGVLEALDDVGGADVAVEGQVLRVRLRDRSGSILGSREVEAPAGCADRSQVGAVLVAAWTGEWRAAHFPTAPTPAAAAAVAPASGASPHHADLGVFGAYVRDGQAGTVGAGLIGRAGYGPVFLSVIGEYFGAREVALGPGHAVYSVLRGGPGLGAGMRVGRVSLDATLSALVCRRSSRGADLQETRSATRVGVAVDGRGRLGFATRLGEPFVYLSLSRDLSGQQATLDDLPAHTTLSPTNLAAGIGFSVGFGKSP